jgi:hypothetical protein
MAHYDIKYSPGSTEEGSTQEGNSIISKPGPVDYGQDGWYGGFDDSGSYLVVSDTNVTSLAGRPTAGATGTADPNMPTFWKVSKSDAAILNLINKLPGSPGGFSNVTDAKAWLDSNPDYGLVTGPDSNVSLLIFGDVNGTLNYWTVSPSGTSGPIDLGSGFSRNNLNWYVIDKGFMLYDNYNQYGAFITANGILLDSRQYSASNDYDDLDGKWLYINDYTNKVFSYSDGVQFGSVDWSALDDYYTDWNYDGATQNWGIIMYGRIGSTSKYYLLDFSINENFGTEIASWDNNLYQVNEFVYGYGDFVALIKKDPNNGYKVLEFSIVNHLGSVLHTVDLSSDDIYDWDVNAFGHGKINFIFSGNDQNQDYLIYFYNGSNDILISRRHERGNNYLYHNTYYRGFYGGRPRTNTSEDFLLVLYSANYGYNYSLGLGYSIAPEYLSLVPYFDGDTITTGRRYTFQDSGVQDKYFSFDIAKGNNFLTRVIMDYGNTNQYKFLSITPSGLSYNSSVAQSAGNDIWYDGDRFLYQNYETFLLTLLTTDGTVLDTLDVSDSGGISAILNRNNTFIVLTSTKARYVNNAHSTFQTMTLPPSYNYYYPNDCESYPEGARVPGKFLIANFDDYSVQIFTDDSYASFSPGYNFTESGQYDLGMSKNTFYIIYRDNSSVWHFNLYDFSGTLLKSHSQAITNLDWYLTQDTLYFRGYENGLYYWTTMSASSINTITNENDFAFIVSDWRQFDCWC